MGPEALNGAINITKTTIDGYSLIAEKAFHSDGAFEDFRQTKAYNLTPAFSYDGAAEQGGAALFGLVSGAAVSKYGNYGAAFDDIAATGPMASQRGSINFRLVVPEENTGTYPTRFHVRSSEELAVLRKEFDKVRPDFVAEYASSAEAARRFTVTERQFMAESGELPRGWVVHHKLPLFRGGENSFENFRVMKSTIHQRYNQRLHWFPDGQNIYGLK